jgi:hypothetical protein
MYETHPMFVQPENWWTVKVWRYMDFPKLVSLIDSRSLFFSRADQLGDPFEGSYPLVNVHSRNFSTGRAQSFSKIMERWPKYTAVNCWHSNDHESAAMWKLYLKSNEGIAVQSTYESLRESIIDDEKVYLGVVKYIDYEIEFLDDDNLLSAFVHKRKSFEHEREIRALVVKFPLRVGAPDPGIGGLDFGSFDFSSLDFGRETIGHGLRIKVDLERLVERIYVAPSAPDWFADLVRALIFKYGYKFDVVHSDLDKQPLF